MKTFYAILPFVFLCQVLGAEHLQSVSTESSNWADEWCNVCCNLLETERAEAVDKVLLARRHSCSARCSRELLCEELDSLEDVQNFHRTRSTDLEIQVGLTDIFDSSQVCRTLGQHARATLRRQGEESYGAPRTLRKLSEYSGSEEGASASSDNKLINYFVIGTAVATLVTVSVLAVCTRSCNKTEHFNEKMAQENNEVDTGMLVSIEAVVLDEEQDTTRDCVVLTAAEAVDIKIDRLYCEEMDEAMKTVSQFPCHLFFKT